MIYIICENFGCLSYLCGIEKCKNETSIKMFKDYLYAQIEIDLQFVANL
jgi:hypothetical protein